MDPISGGMMAAQAIGGVANVVGGLIGGGARRREQRRAKKEMEAMKTHKLQTLLRSRIKCHKQT